MVPQGLEPTNFQSLDSNWKETREGETTWVRDYFSKLASG
jgi:hypothetical protein